MRSILPRARHSERGLRESEAGIGSGANALCPYLTSSRDASPVTDPVLGRRKVLDGWKQCHVLRKAAQALSKLAPQSGLSTVTTRSTSFLWISEDLGTFPGGCSPRSFLMQSMSTPFYVN